MFKTATLLLTGTLLGFCLAIGASGRADSGIRIEIAGGKCQHRLAADASWSYREWGNYETNMELKPSCLQAGVSWMPHWKGFGSTRLGLRIAYVNLGKIMADNTFPAEEPEYFRAKEAQEPVNSATSSFQGHGGSKGGTFGLASEFPIGPIHVGPEAGVAVLYSRWKAYFQNKEEEIYGCGVGWSCADGWHSTLYIGATVRYEWFFMSARRYFNAHASQSAKNPLFIGPTTGPVDQVLIGISIPL